MKTFRVLLCLLTLLPLLAIAPGGYTQSDLNAERDVEATVATQDAELVLGKVTNKSANVYPCIQIMLSLRTPTSSKDLGTLPIYVQNLKANETRDYSQRLPFPAIATKKYLRACMWEGDNPADFPHLISFTVTRARIHPGETTTLEWKTFNADKVLFNTRSPNAAAPGYNVGRTMAFSGSMRIRPLATTKYYIEAMKGAYSVSTNIIVQVEPFRPDDE